MMQFYGAELFTVIGPAENIKITTPIDFYTSILQGIASDGGLLVPDFDFEKKNLEDLLPLNYVDLATEIIGTFAPSDAKEALHTACNQAYGEGLFCDEVVPVKKAGNVYVAELLSRGLQLHSRIWHYLCFQE